MMEKDKVKYIVKHKVWIENENGQGLLGDGKWELMKLICEKGSLKAAIDEMGWGYRSTWNKLKMMEDRLGFNIIVRKRGGAGGGGQTKLTEEGELLIKYFNQLYTEVDLALKSPIDNFLKKLKKLKT